MTSFSDEPSITDCTANSQTCSFYLETTTTTPEGTNGFGAGYFQCSSSTEIFWEMSYET